MTAARSEMSSICLALKQRDKMDDAISVLLVIIFAIGGLIMMTALLTCYVCIFRDLCCPPENRQHNQQQECENPNRGRSNTIPLNDITQGESMPTESERV